MRIMFLFVLAAVSLLLMVPTQNAQAQSETPRVEFGAHYTMLRLRDFGTTDHGVGARLTMNITDGFAVEGEVNFFPRGRDNLAAPTGFNGVSQRTQGLFGVKYGMRSEKAGIFGKIRPGFMHFGENSLDFPFTPSIPTGIRHTAYGSFPNLTTGGTYATMDLDNNFIGGDVGVGVRPNVKRTPLVRQCLSRSRHRN